MLVKADHPDYENAKGIGEDTTAPTGGIWPDYPKVTFESLLGAKMIIEDAFVRPSTIEEGHEYVGFCGHFESPKPLIDKQGDVLAGEVGTKFMSTTSSFRVVELLRQIIEKGDNGFPRKAMVSKVEGAHIKARTLVSW